MNKSVKKINTRTVFEKTVLTKNLGKVYNDIHAIKIDKTDSFDTLLKKFYKVMAKHGICQGNWSEKGRKVSTPEWCMCWHTFRSLVNATLNIVGFMSQPPKHLLAYGKKPALNKKK